MDDVCAVLCVRGRIPRRAVLVDGGALAEKTDHADLPECDLLSRLCEIARATRGLPAPPRRTSDLVQAAVSDNCAHAWAAISDDMTTGDLDVDVAADVLAHNANASALVACLVGAKDPDHRLAVLCLCSRVLRAVGEETRAELGRALACQLRAVMDALAAAVGVMSRDVRDAVMVGFGKILGVTGIPDSRVAELVMHVLTTKRHELLRLFLHVPPSFLEHRPQILPMLLDRAKAVPAESKYALVAMLAKAVAAFPDIVTGHEDTVSDIVCGALPEQFDCREALAAATLAVVSGGCGHALARTLGRALQLCSAALVCERRKNAT